MQRPLPTVAAALAALSLAACEVVDQVQPVPVEEFGVWEDASGKVENAALAELCSDYWDWMLEDDPLQATYLGDPRFHGKLPQRSERARDNDVDQLGAFLKRADRLEPRGMIAFDRQVLELLIARLESDRDLRLFDTESWAVDPLRGPVVQLLNVADVQPIRTRRERDELLERWGAAPSFLRDASMNLRRGAVEGRVSNHTAMQKALAQSDEFLATEVLLSPLVAIATGGGRWVDCPKDGNVARVAHEELGDSRRQQDLLRINRHLHDADRVAAGTRILIPAPDDRLSPAERGEFLSSVLTLVEEEIYPAVAGHRDTLQSLLLRARPDTEPGLVHQRDGEALYRAAIAHHTSLPLAECNAAAIHEFGLAEVARILAEMSVVGQRVFGTGDLMEIQRRLRTDPAMHFTDGAEIVAKAQDSLRRAEAGLRGFFGIRHQAPCEIREIPAHEAPNSTIAYYREPEASGTRPGIYYVNTYAPTTRTRYEAEVLAFHEAVPGHHLQIAVAQEREGLPLFLRHTGWTAFIEGWALYTERLCDEMDLYSGDMDRLGMLSFDAWRASRLVVDTGLHAFGWSREQAIEYMASHTLLALNNIENEVDRYIAWPGQALAYKIGQREILNLRDAARTAFGTEFRYPDFHDVVLRDGAVPLTTLRRNVHSWVESQGGVMPVEASAPGGDGGR